MERREKFTQEVTRGKEKREEEGEKKEEKEGRKGGEEKLSVMGYILLDMYHLLRVMFNTLKLTNSFNSEN